MVAEFIAQRDGLDMIMISALVLLVRERGVESFSFVHQRVAVPDVIALADTGARIGVLTVLVRLGKRVAGVEHPHAVHEHADFKKPVESA